MLTPDTEFLPEIWGLFSVGALWVVLRFAVRLRTVGIRGLSIDDGFAFIALVCWATIIAGINCTYYSKTNIDFTPDEVYDLTLKQLKAARWGSKFYIITLYAYIVMVFSLKAIVILLYQRLTIGDWQKHLLKFTIFLCIAGFIATTLMLSLMCLPFPRRFQVKPLPENKCTASSSFFIVLSCFNATTDAFLLAIPVPLLWTLRIPLHRRIGVFVLLSSGIFVMAACITRVSLTVVPNITVRVIARWGARELSIAMVAVNTAALRPAFRSSFWKSKNTNAAQERQHRWHRNLYAFPPVRHTRRLFKTHINLNSTSAGVSTIQRFIHNDSMNTQHTHHQQSEYPSNIESPPPKAFFSNPLGKKMSFTEMPRSFSRRFWGLRSHTEGGRKQAMSEIVGREPQALPTLADRDVEKAEDADPIIRECESHSESSGRPVDSITTSP